MVVATLQKTHSKAFHFIDVKSQKSFLRVLTPPHLPGPVSQARYQLDIAALLISLGFFRSQKSTDVLKEVLAMRKDQLPGRG